MSIPVTISVTGCSTWTRVFISRKKYSPSWSRPSIVPAPVYATAAAASVAIFPIRARSSVVDGGRGGLLDQLLMPALDRAVPLAEMDHVAMLVGEHLDLDVRGSGR